MLGGGRWRRRLGRDSWRLPGLICHQIATHLYGTGRHETLQTLTKGAQVPKIPGVTRHGERGKSRSARGLRCPAEGRIPRVYRGSECRRPRGSNSGDPLLNCAEVAGV